MLGKCDLRMIWRKWRWWWDRLVVLKTLEMSLLAVYFAHDTDGDEYAACKISRRVREILQPQYHPI